jgi:hypothetical protein
VAVVASARKKHADMTEPLHGAAAAAEPVPTCFEGGGEVAVPALPGPPPLAPAPVLTAAPPGGDAAVNDAPPSDDAAEQGTGQATVPPPLPARLLPVWGTLRSADAYQRLDDDPIGIGQYGEVASAFDKDTGLHVALKKIRMVRSLPALPYFQADALAATGQRA